jgi:hypothetical protein
LLRVANTFYFFLKSHLQPSKRSASPSRLKQTTTGRTSAAASLFLGLTTFAITDVSLSLTTLKFSWQIHHVRTRLQRECSTGRALEG